MNKPEEIRKMPEQPCNDWTHMQCLILAEIAAQLAELNQNIQFMQRVNGTLQVEVK